MEWALKNLKYNLKLSGWLPAALGVLALGGFLAFYNTSHADVVYLQHIVKVVNIVEVVIPLAFGLHAAFVLAPENEPAIELLLSYPKPLTRVLMDRLLLIGLLHGGPALLATLFITVNWNIENIGLALVRWITAGIFLGGLAVFTTQLTRQSAFGALMTTLLWASSLYGGDALLERWSWAWPFHLYLQPQNSTPLHYFFNRILFILVGLGLMFGAAWLLRNDERSLESKSS